MHGGALKRNQHPGFTSPLIISLAMHAAFITAATLATRTNIIDTYRPNYVTVEFAEAPSPVPEATVPPAEAVPAEAVPAEPVAAETKKETPALAEKDAVRIPDEKEKPKAKEKEKKPDESAKLMERLKKIEKNVEKKKSEERVAKRIQEFEGKAKTAPKTPQAAATAPGGGAKVEALSDEEAKDYYDKIAALVRAAWIYPGEAPSDAAVVFKIIIAPSGELVDLIVEKRSGNSIFDTSAIKAVKKAAPFPPPPKLKGNKNFEVGFRFCPKGCK